MPLAQRDVVLSDLILGDVLAADTESQKLVNRFASRPDALWAVSDIAEANSRLGRHQQARDLFRFNLTNYPASDDTIWSLRSFINESIALNDNASADAGIKKLRSEYSGSKNFPMAVVHVGRTLCNAGRPQASELFQYVIDKYPNHEQALFAKVCLGHVCLRQGQDSQAEALFQKILTDYANHPRLAEAIDLMAEGYFDQAMDLEKADAKRVGSAEYAKMVREQQRPKAVMDYYQQAIDKWQIIAQKLPSAPDLTARAWYFISVTYYRHLGDAEKALPYCQKVVDTWPSYEYAWSARALLAACYEALVGSGKITKEEGEPKIRQAYQAVIQEYPDCSLAESTYVKLGLLNLSKGEYDQAAQCLGQFVERYPQARQRPLALIYLGITYERSGKPEVAAELYRSFLKITDPNDPGLNSVRASLEGKKEVEK